MYARAVLAARRAAGRPRTAPGGALRRPPPPIIEEGRSQKTPGGSASCRPTERLRPKAEGGRSKTPRCESDTRSSAGSLTSHADTGAEAKPTQPVGRRPQAAG